MTPPAVPPNRGVGPDEEAEPYTVRVMPRAGAWTRQRTTISSPSRIRSTTSCRQPGPSFSSRARSAALRRGAEGASSFRGGRCEMVVPLLARCGRSTREPPESASISRRLRSSMSSNAEAKPLSRLEAMPSPTGPHRQGAANVESPHPSLKRVLRARRVDAPLSGKRLRGDASPPHAPVWTALIPLRPSTHERHCLRHRMPSRTRNHSSHEAFRADRRVASGCARRPASMGSCMNRACAFAIVASRR